jgi:hypothetical protein
MARNCEGCNEKSGFSFQIGSIKLRSDAENSFIKVCPSCYVTSFSKLLWMKYQDQRLRKELGIKTDDKELTAIAFAAFRTFAIANQDYDEFDRKRKEKKQTMNRGGKLG